MKLSLPVAACLLLASAATVALSPAELNRITFENRTGAGVSHIFVSPSDSRHWGSDILGSSQTLADGASRAFFIHYPDPCDRFDIRAVSAAGEAFTVYGHEICDGEETRVRLLADAPDADYVAPELAEVILRNGTDYELWYLFFSPGDSAMWGVDQLDSTTVLEPGGSRSVLLPLESVPVGYDLLAVDEDEVTYTLTVTAGSGPEPTIYTIENHHRL